MKLKVNWKELARQLWASVKPVRLRARHSRDRRHHRIASNRRQRRQRLERRRAIEPAHGEVKLHCAL